MAYAQRRDASFRRGERYPYAVPDVGDRWGAGVSRSSHRGDRNNGGGPQQNPLQKKLSPEEAALASEQHAVALLEVQLRKMELEKQCNAARAENVRAKMAVAVAAATAAQGAAKAEAEAKKLDQMMTETSL